jgi:hypothetical protein
MKEEELKRLIAKYYNGESTEEEESSLRNYFAKNNIPQGYEAEKAIFGYFDESSEIPEPSIGFEARILAGIDASERKRRSQRMKRYLLPMLSAAAGFLILIGSYFFFIHRTEPLDTYKDPKIAYAETMKILMAVSSQLNRGVQTLEPVSKIDEMTTKSFKAINKSAIIIEKNLKNLNYLQKAIEITNMPLEKNKNK